jgi:hypothetical protein
MFYVVPHNGIVLSHLVHQFTVQFLTKFLDPCINCDLQLNDEMMISTQVANESSPSGTILVNDSVLISFSTRSEIHPVIIAGTANMWSGTLQHGK